MKPKRTILCVDDNEQLLSIRKVMLETRGYRVISCFTAEEAIRTLRPDMKVRHEFLLIYKLALRILVEEIKVSNILIQLDYQHPHLHLTFFSTEVLPDERSTRYFRLLEEMRTRAQAIHGTLDIQYDDRGAAILLICPSIF